MVDGCAMDGREDGKGRRREKVRNPGGLKAGAGLRGPSSTSVRYTSFTWTLFTSSVILFYAIYSLFSFLSSSSRIYALFSLFLPLPLAT